MDRNENERYAQFGRASLIPGIMKSIEFLQAMLDDLRIQLAAAEGERIAPKKTRKQASAGGRYGWSEDPEERKQQMAERIKKGAGRKGKPARKRRKPAFTINHPNHPDNPNHAAWVKKTVKARAKAKKAKMELVA